jgi:hypothetical protein
MVNFLTMKEAATLTGKSPSSIRRIIYPIIHDDKHADRKHIRPTIEEVKQLRSKGENFPWRVSEGLLRREVPLSEASTKPRSATHGSSAATGSEALVDMLRRELDIKNQQITQQMDLINGLSERLREGNILIGSLQKHLALPDGANRAKEFVDAPTPAGEPSEKKKSSRWFGRFFRAP